MRSSSHDEVDGLRSEALDWVAARLRADRAVVVSRAEATRIAADGQSVSTGIPGDPEQRLVVTTTSAAVLGADVAPILETAAAMYAMAARRLRASASTTDRDDVTGLAGRPRVRAALGTMIERLANETEDSRRRVATVSVDIDDLRAISASEGHDATDQVLRTVAARLTDLIPGAVVGRLATDGFVAALETTAGTVELLDDAERWLQSIQQPVTVGSRTISVRACLGIAVARRSDASVDDLMRHADAALRHAESRGPGTIQLYNERVGEAARARVRTRRDLDGAADEEFAVFFQPIIELTEGVVSGAEALVRWQHPDRGLLGPGAFIEVAEESGMIVRLGAAVLTSALRTVRDWIDRDIVDPDFRVSVNVAPQQMSRADFCDTVAAVFEETGTGPANLCIEVTESAVVRFTDRTFDNARRLREMGITIAIDDFGTGYSSLAQLRQLPADTVKLDQSFVADLDVDDSLATLISGVVTIARGMRLGIVAEGAETAGQAVMLKALGCDRAQGYLWTKPLPADGFAAWLSGDDSLIDLAEAERAEADQRTLDAQPTSAVAAHAATFSRR